MIQSVPLVGEWLVFLAFGGDFPAAQTLPRFYISHVLLVPGVLVALISLHLTVLIGQKHSQFPGPGRTQYNVVGSRLWLSYTAWALFAWALSTLQILVLTLPWLTGLVAFVVARALKLSDAAGLTGLTAAHLRAALSRSGHVSGDARPEPGRAEPEAAVAEQDRAPRQCRYRTTAVSSCGPRATERGGGGMPNRAVSIALTSNGTFTGRAEAIKAALDVYPGVPVRQVDPPGGPAVIAEQRRRRRLARFLAVGGWLALWLLGRRRSRR